MFKAALAMLDSDGDPFKAATGMLKGQGATDLITAVISAGIMDKLTTTFSLATAAGAADFMQHAKASLAHHAVNAGLNAVVQGEDLGKALTSNLPMVVVNTFGRYMSQEIGIQNKTGAISNTREVLSHALIGGVTGAIAGGEKGALSGIAAASVTAIAGKYLTNAEPAALQQVRTAEQKLGRALTPEETTALVGKAGNAQIKEHSKQLSRNLKLGEFAATGLGIATGTSGSNCQRTNITSTSSQQTAYGLEVQRGADGILLSSAANGAISADEPLSKQETVAYVEDAASLQNINTHPPTDNAARITAARIAGTNLGISREPNVAVQDELNQQQDNTHMQATRGIEQQSKFSLLQNNNVAYEPEVPYLRSPFADLPHYSPVSLFSSQAKYHVEQVSVSWGDAIANFFISSAYAADMPSDTNTNTNINIFDNRMFNNFNLQKSFAFPTMLSESGHMPQWLRSPAGTTDSQTGTITSRYTCYGNIQQQNIGYNFTDKMLYGLGYGAGILEWVMTPLTLLSPKMDYQEFQHYGSQALYGLPDASMLSIADQAGLQQSYIEQGKDIYHAIKSFMNTPNQSLELHGPSALHGLPGSSMLSIEEEATIQRNHIASNEILNYFDRTQAASDAARASGKQLAAGRIKGKAHADVVGPGVVMCMGGFGLAGMGRNALTSTNVLRQANNLSRTLLPTRNAVGSPIVRMWDNTKQKLRFNVGAKGGPSAAVERFTPLANNISKSEARELLRAGG